MGKNRGLPRKSGTGFGVPSVVRAWTPLPVPDFHRLRWAIRPCQLTPFDASANGCLSPVFAAFAAHRLNRRLRMPAFLVLRHKYHNSVRVFHFFVGRQHCPKTPSTRWHSAAAPQIKNQKANIKRQKSLSRPADRVGKAPSRRSRTPIFRVAAAGPQSKQSSMNQSSMTQFLAGPGNWPLRGIFAAREETWTW